MAQDAGFSQPTFGADQTPFIAPDYMESEAQPVSYDSSGTSASGDLAYARQGSRDWYDRVSLGGYGEFHANFQEGADNDLFDLHRIVMLMGVQFNDWLTFSSELEVEHAFVEKDSGAYLMFEQAYVEYAHNDCIHFRAGRVLTPIGIINERHEPPSFNGVERPSFAKYIIPSTWSVDGIGITGRLGPALKYKAYLVTSLNGDLFEEKDGIRDGRIKERGSLSQTAFTGRIDLFPFAMNPSPNFQTLRFGASTFLGGLDNGNKGNDPGVDAALHLISADMEYNIKCFDFRGVIAYTNIDGAENLHNHAASRMTRRGSGGGRLQGVLEQVADPEMVKHGRTLAEGNCTDCHRYYAPSEYAPEAWPGIVESMGAMASTSHYDQWAIATYLVEAASRHADAGE